MNEESLILSLCLLKTLSELSERTTSIYKNFVLNIADLVTWLLSMMVSTVIQNLSESGSCFFSVSKKTDLLHYRERKKEP